MENPVAYFMIGQPACGKSTWVSNFSTAFSEEANPVYLSTDALIEKWASNIGQTYDQCFKDFIENAEKEMFRRMIEAVEQNKNIIIDRTNLTVKSRARLMARLPTNYTKIAIVVECNKEVQKERLANRPGKSIPDYVIERMAASYEPPTTSEGFALITHFNNGKVNNVLDAAA